MGDHLTLERYYWFHNQIKEDCFPNASNLAKRFEISSRTAQRTIEFMRDRFRAPMEYDQVKRGYRYTDHSFCLPTFQVAQEELVSILLARNLLSESAEGIISETIQSFGQKLMAVMGEIGYPPDKLRKAFSAVWNGHSPAPALTFQIVTEALLNNRVMTCRYISPPEYVETERKIAPHHLQHYMGSWVLIGWCLLRDDWRKFYLSRMAEPLLTKENFDSRPGEEWEPLIHSSFGIFQGGTPIPVILHFNAFRAPWIREQIWHPDQKIEELEEGSLRLTIPVTDFRELKMKILQFGSDVEVIEPEALREEVTNEIEKMGKIYQNE